MPLAPLEGILTCRREKRKMFPFVFIFLNIFFYIVSNAFDLWISTRPKTVPESEKDSEACLHSFKPKSA